MLDEITVQQALRSKLLTLSVATTGTISLASTTTQYVRTAGSFLADGFLAGMEITPAGFSNNSLAVITAVSALTITAKRIIATVGSAGTTYSLGALTAETAAGGRSLSVGLPSQRAWENDEFEPTAGIPWVGEEFNFGPHKQVTIGEGGDLQGEPQYFIHFNVPAGTRLTAKRYTHAGRVLFAPKWIPVVGGTLRPHAKPAPRTGPLLTTRPGFAGQTLEIPLEIRSPNVF